MMPTCDENLIINSTHALVTLYQGVRRDILRVMDEKMVVVLDPDEDKHYLDKVGPGGLCSTRHQVHFRPSFLELNFT